MAVFSRKLTRVNRKSFWGVFSLFLVIDIIFPKIVFGQYILLRYALSRIADIGWSRSVRYTFGIIYVLCTTLFTGVLSRLFHLPKDVAIGVIVFGMAARLLSLVAIGCIPGENGPNAFGDVPGMPGQNAQLKRVFE